MAAAARARRHHAPCDADPGNTPDQRYAKCSDAVNDTTAGCRNASSILPLPKAGRGTRSQYISAYNPTFYSNLCMAHMSNKCVRVISKVTYQHEQQLFFAKFNLAQRKT